MLVLAPHGGGKSAYRLMVQGQCLPLSDRSDILGVLYLPDDLLLGKLRNGEPIHTADHVRAILSQSLCTLLDTLSRAKIGPALYRDLKRSRLAWYCREYVPHVLSPTEVLSVYSTL